MNLKLFTVKELIGNYRPAQKYSNYRPLKLLKKPFKSFENQFETLSCDTLAASVFSVIGKSRIYATQGWGIMHSSSGSNPKISLNC